MATKTTTKTTSILGAIEEALSTSEELRDELQNWFDNLPEQFQEGSKGDELQEAIDALEEGISNLEDAQNSGVTALHEYTIEYSAKVYPKSTYWSRAKRLEQATEALQAVPTEAPEDLTISEDDSDEAQQLLDDVQTALDSLQSVTFPAMR